MAYLKSHDLHTNLKNEVLCEIEPHYIKVWLYENNEPYIKIYDIKSSEVNVKKYFN